MFFFLKIRQNPKLWYSLSLVLIYSRKLREKLPPKILISLCVSLLALLIVFLVGIENTSDKVGCQVVAALLHYFLLTTFFWMGVEAFNIYQMFVKVFRKGSEKRFLLRSSLVAWCKWSNFFLSSVQSSFPSIRAAHFNAIKTFLKSE